MYQILGVTDKNLRSKVHSQFSKSVILSFRDIHVFPENWQKSVKMADFGQIKGLPPPPKKGGKMGKIIIIASKSQFNF